MVRFHIGRINGGIERIGVDMIIKTFQLRNEVQQVVEVEAFQCSCFRVFYHSDSSTCINQQYGGGKVCHISMVLRFICKYNDKFWNLRWSELLLFVFSKKS